MATRSSELRGGTIRTGKDTCGTALNIGWSHLLKLFQANGQSHEKSFASSLIDMSVDVGRDTQREYDIKWSSAMLFAGMILVYGRCVYQLTLLYRRGRHSKFSYHSA